MNPRVWSHTSLFHLLILTLLCVSGSHTSDTSSDFPKFRDHPHLFLHSEHHLRRIRDMLCGLFGIGIIALGAYFLYQYFVTRSRRNHFDEPAGPQGVFSERGALLPTHHESGQHPTAFQSFQTMWPFNTRLFNQQPRGVIRTVNVDAPITTDFCNPEDIRKSNYNPWERI